MKTVFEKSVPGRGSDLFPALDVPEFIPEEVREAPPALPELAEIDITRHYSALARRAHGVSTGFYPLGSCTMKYNPRVNEEIAALPGFTGIHPLQPAETVRGCLEVMRLTAEYLAEITGMDAMTLQPAAGAHGEFTGLLLIKAYHRSRGDSKRTRIIVPDSAHGTNPASAAMAGFSVTNIDSAPDGRVDLDALRASLGDDVAGLMLTNPNTLGLFDANILEITRLVHECGGLCYYDGANLNAIAGVARPGDMGFDVIHLNLHKTFSTPHGGGGPGSGPVGCKRALADFLPGSALAGSDGLQVRSFYGNFLVVVRALGYILSLGREGIPNASKTAVLNANYLQKKLREAGFETAQDCVCMHEFVLTLEKLKEETGVSALDAAKALIDRGIHPPTMYFPLIVHEALMFEPTETESPDTLDNCAAEMADILRIARENPEQLHGAPHHAQIKRPDEVRAAREPKLRA